MSGDETWTPKIVAEDMIKWFKPEGKVLEPCYGTGDIHKFLPEGSPFCEISMGKDFFNYNKKVDWIITNPPFSKYRKFILHGLTLSNNSVWLMPTWKFFLSDGLVRSVYEYGGIKEIRHYATGSKLGWEMVLPLFTFKKNMKEIYLFLFQRFINERKHD